MIPKKFLNGVLVLFFFVAILTYFPVFTNELVNWDDYLLIIENPMSHGISFQNLWSAFTSYDPELYIPLTFVSYQLNYLIGGFEPFIYHLTNLVLHTVNSFLVGWVILLLMMQKKLNTGQDDQDHYQKFVTVCIALFCGLLFLVHPIHTEAVAWASARKDVLSGLFFLISLVTYMFYALRWDAMAWRPNGRLYIISLITFTLGLLSKVTVVTLPLILLLIDWRAERKIDRGNLKEKVPYFLLSGLFIVIALFGKTGGSALVIDKTLIAGKAIIFYLQKLVMPTSLSVLYPYTNPIGFMTPDLAVSMLLVLLISAFAWYSRRWTKELLFVWTFFLVALIPTFTNFAKAGGVFLDVYFASDRYVYIPSIAIFFLLGLILLHFVQKHQAAVYSFACVILVVFGVMAHRQSRTWETTGSLFLNVLKHYDNSQLAHNNVGAMHYQNNDFDEAITELKISLSIRPTERTYFNLGRSYMEVGRIQEGVDSYLNSLDINPYFSDSLINYGVFLMDQGYLEDALVLFLRAVEIGEDDTLLLLYFNLGSVYEQLGNIEEAIQAYQKVVELDPSDIEAVSKVEELRR